jgi:hypothetical protein
VSARLRAVAADTVAIVEAGGYRAPGGAWVAIGDAVARAVAGTRLHLPDEPMPPSGRRNPAPSLEVTNESTLAAARRLSTEGGDVAGLVFASARNPGGGFLTGALSQEEDVARASALHACLVTAMAFYELGAWGGGVFGNDPTVMADAFAAALTRIDYFDHVVFAVLDRQRPTTTYDAFAARMQGHPTGPFPL